MRLIHNPPIDQVKVFLGRLKNDGCNAIAIIPHHYVSLGDKNAVTPPPASFGIPGLIYPDKGQDPSHPFHNTPEPELVHAVAQAAANMGMKVLIKPHIDSYYGAWRGWISVESRRFDWIDAYKNLFLKRYVDIARQVDGAMLCLGCELLTVSVELKADFWIGIANWVRGQGFGGPLTYAANWGWGDDAEYKILAPLWQVLDYIGVDAYWPLVASGYTGSTDVATLKAGWNHRIVDADWSPRTDDTLLAFSKQLNKPLLFTEIGYANHSKAAEDPSRDPVASDVRDDGLQLRLAQAFQQRWLNEPRFAGYFWWDAWYDDTTRVPISDDIINKPIEHIVFAPQAAPQPQPQPVNTGTAIDTALHINGIHGPNSHFADFRSRPNGPTEGADAAWRRVREAKAHWIELLWPDHSRADAEAARAAGLQVLVRAPGEGIVHFESVQAIIREFGSSCDVISVGNEPFPNADFNTWSDLLWNHAFYMEDVWKNCAAMAHAAGILLCTPGWAGGFDAPVAGTRLAATSTTRGGDLVIDQGLAQRLLQVYSAYDVMAVHCYDQIDLDHVSTYRRIDRWHALFNKPVYITEYGIASRFLPGTTPDGSDILKAQRYARFIQGLAKLGYVEGAFMFILGGTNDFAAFTGGGYDPNGINSYWLGESAYVELGRALSSQPLAAGFAAGFDDTAALDGGTRHIGWNDRPHANFSFVGTPTISPAVFAQWLHAKDSPALAEADALDYYLAVYKRNLNPALALAFFHHESQCATDPDSFTVRFNTKNWGNLRPRKDGSIGRAYSKATSPDQGTFRVYHNFMDSLLDWCDLWFTPLYANLSVAAALEIYAPRSDKNNPNRYTEAVLDMVTAWDDESGEFDVPAEAAPVIAAPSPYRLQAAPSVTVDTFREVLVQAASPVLDEADAANLYAICTGSGVDPAVALAFFQQETNCGTQAGADHNKNWANLWDHANKHTQIYTTWSAGLRDMCARWTSPPFTSKGAPTVASIVPLHRGTNWANNDQYIQQVCDRVDALRALDVVPAGVMPLGLAPAAHSDNGNGGHAHAAAAPMMSMADFAATLTHYASPALREAPARIYYDIVRGYGLDPADALAAFAPSGFGTSGGAAGVKNWASLSADTAPGRATRTVNAGGANVRGYDSWQDSLRDWCEQEAGIPTVAPLTLAATRAAAQYSPAAVTTPQQKQKQYAAAAAGHRGRTTVAFDEEPVAPADAAPAAAPGGAGGIGHSALATWKRADASNFTPGRNGHQVIAVVNHIMVGNLDGTAESFATAGFGASSHYGVGSDGRIYQFVDEHDRAWGNGPIYHPNTSAVPWMADVVNNNGDPNAVTISIEWAGSHVGKWEQWQHSGKNDTMVHGSITKWWTPNEKQYAAGLALIRDICNRNGIDLTGDFNTTRQHIVRHSDIDNGKKWFCPGEGFPLQRLIDDLRGGSVIDYPLVAPASIPVETFREALLLAGSPVLDETEAADLYTICTSSGVDPAVALAFFQQETNCGTQAGADQNKNWANLWDHAHKRTQIYATWRAGLRDMCARWSSPPYTDRGTPTVASLVALFRADWSNNDEYIRQVCGRVAALQAEAGHPWQEEFASMNTTKDAPTPTAGLSGPAPTLTIPVSQKNPDKGTVSSIELIDGAGAVHLIEVWYLAANNNVTWITYTKTLNGAVQRQDTITLGPTADANSSNYWKIDGLTAWPHGHNLWLRAKGHQITGASFGASGCGRGDLMLAGVWAPEVSASVHYPAFNPQQQTFNDVAPGSTYHRFVEALAGLGIIAGYSDGTFRPNATITRGQICKVVFQATGGE